MDFIPKVAIFTVTRTKRTQLDEQSVVGSQYNAKQQENKGIKFVSRRIELHMLSGPASWPENKDMYK